MRLPRAQRRVTAIMTPRRDVVWLERGLGRDEMLRALRASPHSELPVARGSVDEIVIGHCASERVADFVRIEVPCE